MRLISRPTIPLWMALRPIARYWPAWRLYGMFSPGYRRLHWRGVRAAISGKRGRSFAASDADSEDCTSGEFREQVFRESEIGYLLPAMGDEHVDRSAVDEQVHVGVLMVAERGVEGGLQRVGQQEAGLGPGTSAVARKGDPQFRAVSHQFRLGAAESGVVQVVMPVVVEGRLGAATSAPVSTPLLSSLAQSTR